MQNLNIKRILNCAIECKNLFTNEFQYKHILLTVINFQIFCFNQYLG